ncbi:MAG: AraC family transcriptional regulator [Kribbellaceae bacterium]|nr:AraC family transcriptional regulator [Kribbellaceae bacterium]
MNRPETGYSATLARCVLTTAGSGLDPRQLLRESGVPGATLDSDYGLVSSRPYLRLWECAEFHQDDPETGLRIAKSYRLGHYGLFDYLFSTAATVADGLAAVRIGPPLATNHRYRPASDDRDGESTTRLSLVDGGGERGAELAVQAAYASTLARIRAATREPVVPVRIALRQPPPRKLRGFVDAFGTDHIDFGASYNGMTMRARDLALPLRTADPTLAAILRDHAATLASSMLSEPTWPTRVRKALAEVLPSGDATLAGVAARLAVSPRTLQRRLAEDGTTWRKELDAARRAAARVAPASATQSSLARRLGYSDARALRRAARRWRTDHPAA